MFKLNDIVVKLAKKDIPSRDVRLQTHHITTGSMFTVENITHGEDGTVYWLVGVRSMKAIGGLSWECMKAFNVVNK